MYYMYSPYRYVRLSAEQICRLVAAPLWFEVHRTEARSPYIVFSTMSTLPIESGCDNFLQVRCYVKRINITKETG